jgi:competence/damage-inducible protein CinA-like protein
MNVEILITGDEIRSGAVIDRNSAHIAMTLEEAGFNVVRHTCVGDNVEDLVLILQEIGSRSDAALVTGGLGPTQDDLTAQAAATSVGVDLVLNLPALHGVESYFKIRNRMMPDSNKKQAMLPKGADLILNPVGTAPGFMLKINRCMFFFLPGVPFEMQRMLSDTVLTQLEKLRGSISEFNMVKTISTFGLTESAAAERVSGISRIFPEITLGFRAKFPEIQIKLYGRGKDKEALNQRMVKAGAAVIEEIGDNVFSEDENPIEAVVGRLLLKQNATLAVAESCTGGLISHLLTNVPGSSDYFLFSGVTYSNEAKKKVLGVSSKVLERYGAVHEKTAKEMAAGVRRMAESDYGLATSGIAGPDGGTDEKPVGTVCIGLATRRSILGFRYLFQFNSRWRNKKIFAMKALDVLRRHLQA